MTTNRQLCLFVLLYLSLYIKVSAQQIPEGDTTKAIAINNYVSEVINVVCPFKNDIEY
jgi:hypothetical protein